MTLDDRQRKLNKYEQLHKHKEEFQWTLHQVVYGKRKKLEL